MSSQPLIDSRTIPLITFKDHEGGIFMDPIVTILIGVIVIILALMALSGLRVVQQYERGVIFILGRFTGAKGPGLFWVPPFVTRMIKVDLRIVTLTVPPQEVISRDNVTIKVTAVIYFYVVDPQAAVINVMNFMQATTQIGQTTLRMCWANPNWMNCSPSATRSTVSCRPSLTSIRNAGASR